MSKKDKVLLAFHQSIKKNGGFITCEEIRQVANKNLSSDELYELGKLDSTLTIHYFPAPQLFVKADPLSYFIVQLSLNATSL